MTTLSKDDKKWFSGEIASQLKPLFKLVEMDHKRIDRIERRLDHLVKMVEVDHKRIGYISDHVDRLHERMGKLDKVDVRLAAMDKKFTAVLDMLGTEVEGHERRLSRVEMAISA